jgi:hypothetical protein
MNIRLTTDSTSKLCKHEAGKVSQEVEINPENYPALVAKLKDCDNNDSCTGINVVDKGAGYEVMLHAATGWTGVEKDKGALFMYDTAVEGAMQLNNEEKAEIDNLLALL